MKLLSDKTTGGNLTADDWNEVPSELQNTITNAGIGLTDAVLDQFAKATAHYAATSTFYTDSGSGTAYVLAVINTNFAPPAYVDGMEAEFVPDNTNTGTATVDVGGLGVKTITGSSTTGIITAGEYVRLRFNSGSDEFDIVSTSASQDNLHTGDTFPSSDPDILTRSALLADGSSVSRTTYADLFAKIGVAYGSESGSTFNLPNLGLMKNPGTSNTGDWNIPVDYTSGIVTNVSVDTNTKDVWITDSTISAILKSSGGTGAFTEVGDYDLIPSVANLVGISVDSNTGDVFAIDNGTDQLHILTGGSGSFVQFGDYSGDVGGTPAPRGVAINKITKDIFIADYGNSSIYKLAKSTGSFYKIGKTTATFTDVAVNYITGDVWAVDIDENIYALAPNGEELVVVAILPSVATTVGIAVNSFTGDVWVSNGSNSTVYKLSNGIGELIATGAFSGTFVSGGSVDEGNGNVYFADQASPESEIKRLDGQLDTASINWYIKT